MEELKASLTEIFSPQELQVFVLKNEGYTTEEIANKLERNRRQISVVIGRINNKLNTIQKNGIIIDYAENTMGLKTEDEIIAELYKEEQYKTVKLTLNEAIFLQNSSSMSTKDKKRNSIEQSIKQKLGTRGKSQQIVNRRWSDEERKEFLEKRKKLQAEEDEIIESEKDAYSILREYYYLLEEGTQNIELMAKYERILKTKKMIRQTPYINKLNAKTGTCLRAVSAGQKVVVINNENKDLLPPDAKLVENNKEEAESVWVVDKWV